MPTETLEPDDEGDTLLGPQFTAGDKQ